MATVRNLKAAGAVVVLGMLVGLVPFRGALAADADLFQWRLIELERQVRELTQRVGDLERRMGFEEHARMQSPLSVTGRSATTMTPADEALVDEAMKFIRDPQFQALTPTARVSVLADWLAAHSETLKALSDANRKQVAGEFLRKHRSDIR